MAAATRRSMRRWRMDCASWPKGHGAIGRRESLLKKRTPPLSCLVKKLGDMASKERFWNSSRLMSQQIIGLMEEPW
jgi:hypothetical protein